MRRKNGCGGTGQMRRFLPSLFSLPAFVDRSSLCCVSLDTILLVADSERDADMLYAVGLFVPDPFIFLGLGDRKIVVMSDMELDRARRQLRQFEVIAWNRCLRELGKGKSKRGDMGRVIRWLLRQHRVRKVTVPASFPHGLARQLEEMKIRIKVCKGPIFPERQLKTADEVKKINAAQVMAEVGLAEGMQVLKSARMARNGQLLYHDIPLTADKLRSVINVAIWQAGGSAARTIVACGRQACDPHEEGHGLLRANQPIILGIFPRSQKTGYFGNITRTVVRGRASEAVRRLYYTVARGQALALARLGESVPCADIHGELLAFFEKEGYKTGSRHGRMQGFLHGAGHGLGLDLHEAPILHTHSKEVLQIGHVVAVEPGLYYPELGGVRLEDVIHLSAQGPLNLTQFEQALEI